MIGDPGVLIAVDPGEVRVGIAATDPGQVLASPVATVAAAESVSAVVEVATERQAVLIIVGLPLSLSGEERKAARRARSYGRRLAVAVGGAIPVYLVDERLTTVAASTTLRAAGHDARSARRVVDQAAATALLQGVLDAASAQRVPCAVVLSQGMGERVDSGPSASDLSDQHDPRQ
jgi:putative holliday junction resolvase